MPVLYHASTNKNLELIKPKPTLSKDKFIGDFVFATKDKILATMYLATKGYATLLGPRDTPPNIVICADEKEYLKNDKGGAIYELPSDSFKDSPQKGLTDFELVSKSAVTPLSKVVYESSLEAMKKLGIEIRFVDQRTFDSLVNSPNQKELIRKLPLYEQ